MAIDRRTKKLWEIDNVIAKDDFAKIQRYMLVAKEEGATKTYAILKKSI